MPKCSTRQSRPPKSGKDPNAPKRNSSAYVLFQTAHRDTFRRQHPEMTFIQLAKSISERYAELTPDEKAGWKARAEADKARYLHELAQYVPPEGYDSKGDPIEGQAKASTRKVPLRDIKAPRNCMSAYQLYCNGLRDLLSREKPNLSFGQVARYTWRMYNALTPEEKATWEVRAHQDKARFDAEMSVYVPPPGHDKFGHLLDEYKNGRVTIVPSKTSLMPLAVTAGASEPRSNTVQNDPNDKQVTKKEKEAIQMFAV